MRFDCRPDTRHAFERAILALLIPLAASGEEAPQPADDCSCAGFYYTAKRDDVPVYEEPDRAATVLRKLKLGEKVCVAGIQNEFAIVVPAEAGDKKEMPAKNEGLQFAVKADLWAPPEAEAQQRSPLQTLRGYYEYVKGGGVIEDPLLPYRPLMNLFSGTEKKRRCEKKESGNQDLKK